MGVNSEKCIGCKECIAACPFDIPRWNPATDRITKCDLCYTRLQADQKTRLRLSCPTGAIQIGDKNAMIAAAYKRVQVLGGDANVYGDKFVDGTHVLYVLQEKPSVYDELPRSRRSRRPSSSGRTS